MNLKFTPPLLALALSISASARIVSKANVDTVLAERSSFFQAQVAEKITARRRAKQNSAAIFDQEAYGQNFYFPDVGILQGKTRRHRIGTVLKNGADDIEGIGKIPRFLQAEAPLCGTNGTCPHSACVCRANRDVISDQCAPVINAVCNGYADKDSKEWNIDGCINDYQDSPNLHEYLKTVFCQLSKCFDDGGTYGSCFCEFYQSACKMLGDERPYTSDDRALGFCAADSCCQNKTDESGRVSCTYGAPSRVEYQQDHPRCGINGTCYPAFCDSYVSGVGYEGLAVPLNTICNGVTDANGTKWGFEGCYRDYPDYPDYQLYVKTTNCEISKCLVDGDSYGSCICRVYHSLCEAFGDVRKYSYDPTSAGFCTVDTCCKSKATEAGRMACFELTNSTPTTPPSIEEGVSNSPAQNSSSIGTNNTPDAATEETPAANDPASSSSAPRTTSLSSAGALSSVVAAAAVSLSILGCDV